MRKLLTILLLLPMLVEAKGKRLDSTFYSMAELSAQKGLKDVNSFFDWDDLSMHYIVGRQIDSLTLRCYEYSLWGGDAPYAKVRFWTNYTWSTSNGNILVNKTNYPSLNQGDTVKIPPKSGDYRSFSMDHIGAVNWGIYAVIYWETGAQIALDTTSIRNANVMDSCNWIKVYGWVMNNQIDVAFYTYQNTGYSHRIYFQNCTFRAMNGFFGSGDVSGSTLPDYTGGNDTTNCFYYITWDGCRFDSLVGGNSGNTAIWLGALNKKQAWVHAEIMNCYFGHYSSKTAPAGYIHATNVWGLYIHDNQFEQLGKLGPVFTGHAAQIFLSMCYTEIHHNLFFGQNLGNCIRNYGGLGRVYGMTLMTTMGWSINYDGRSRVWDNIDMNSLKYPFMENNYSSANAATLGYVQAMTGAEIWFITGYKLYLDATSDAYNAAANDCYENDSVFVKGCAWFGPIDTNWTACGVGTFGRGCNKLINAGNGPIAIYDTAYNSFTEFAKNTGIDSITLKPFAGGFVVGRVTSYPAYITDDYYHVARVGPQPSGAITGLINQIRRRPGAKNRWKN